MYLATKICTLAVFILFLPQSVLAQVTGGSVQGRTTDESGSAVAGVSIVARHLATDTSRSTTSDDSGFYRITELQVGGYEFTVSLTGFATQVRSGITIFIGQEATLDFSLKLATVSEIVTVEDELPILEPIQFGT